MYLSICGDPDCPNLSKVTDLEREIDNLRAELKRLKDRLNHQTEDDVASCKQGKHKDCGRANRA